MSKETTSIEYAGITFILTGIYTPRVWTNRFEEGNDASFDAHHIAVEHSVINLHEALPRDMIAKMEDLAKEQLNDY